MVVSGDFVQGSYTLLPFAGDRARAALFFSRKVASAAHEANVELARWFLRAALSEFRSIFDLLNVDLKDMGRHTEWARSSQRSKLEADAIVSVLRKVRDFAIHSANVQGIPKTFKVSSPHFKEPTSDLPSIVIEPLDRANHVVGRELHNFTDEVLEEFNRQSEGWPADLLLQIAIFRSSVPLASFLKAGRAA